MTISLNMLDLFILLHKKMDLLSLQISKYIANMILTSG